jgi:putative endonuclease
MAFYVYIIQSEMDGSYYKGCSEQPATRILQHNNGDGSYTSNKTPWQLVHVEECTSKRDALIREKALKKYSHEQISRLIASAKNIVGQFR